VTKKEYQGIISLGTACRDFACLYWVTFKQASSLGGKIRKGEKGTVIAFWQCKERVTENDLGEEETRRGFLLRYSTVFNLEQTEGIEWKVTGEGKTTTTAEAIISNYKNAPEIIFEDDRAELCNINFFGDHSYSKEELVAEIGAAFLCHEAGILNVTIANSEAYIAEWARALGNDPKMIMEAAAKTEEGSQVCHTQEKA